MSLTLTKSPTNTRVSLKRPSSYAIHVTSPFVSTYIIPLFFRDEVKAQRALDEVRENLGTTHFQIWLISPAGHLMDYRGPA